MISKSKNLFLTTLCAAAIGFSFVTAQAQAGAIIKYGDTYLGVNNEGHLNISAASEGLSIPAGFVGPMVGSDFFGDSPEAIPIGLYRNGIGDSTSPGCLCEGWGVAATTNVGRISGFASIANGGIGGITDGEFGSTSSTATSKVNLTAADISVTHAFGPSLAAGVFQASVTITNNTGSAIDDLVYRRAMDWDIPPDEFNEYVTHGGVEANLEANGGNVRFASDNGFAPVDPRQSAGSINSSTVNSDFVDNGPDDHGSVFDFAFDSLEDGESRTFNIFYGSTANEGEAQAAIALLGADVYSFGQYSGRPINEDDEGEGGCDGEICEPVPSFFSASLADDELGGPENGEPATFLFAFGGVGGVEPGDSAEVPVLPFVTAPGEFVFVSPQPRLWFDPPFADGFSYELAGGGLFTSVMTPDASFGFGDVDVVVDGVVVGTLAPGGTFDLSPFATSAFSLVGLDMLLDIADPDLATAFPVFLDFTGSPTELFMAALEVATTVPESVPEPAPLLLLFGAIAFLSLRKRTSVR
ncbi:MAG: hypothetical protein ACJASL_004118 [Paraglaciecola sp.]